MRELPAVFGAACGTPQQSLRLVLFSRPFAVPTSRLFCSYSPVSCLLFGCVDCRPAVVFVCVQAWCYTVLHGLPISLLLVKPILCVWASSVSLGELYTLNFTLIFVAILVLHTPMAFALNSVPLRRNGMALRVPSVCLCLWHTTLYCVIQHNSENIYLNLIQLQLLLCRRGLPFLKGGGPPTSPWPRQSSRGVRGSAQKS